MDKIGTIFVTLLNLSLFSITLFMFYVVEDGRPHNDFNSSLARLAIQNQFEKEAILSKDTSVQMNQSCVEVSGSSATAIATGTANVSAKLIDGVYVDETTSFKYKADITTHCSPHNLNCYSVDHMNIDAVTERVPSL